MCVVLLTDPRLDLMRTTLIGCILFFAGCAPSATPPSEEAQVASITVTLARQFQRAAAAWNRGDLDAFMDDYLADSTTTFVGSGGLLHGVDAIRSRYAPLFGHGASRDSLRFEQFEVRVLGNGLVLVTARYILYRGPETTASGPFTLIMRQGPDGWKIIHDHSSSD